MLIAEARVVTERSGRYLLQLCSHIDLVARSHPDMQATAEWSDDRGVITFGASRCTLHAEPGALWLTAQAPDAESLDQVQARIGSRLEHIGRRDGLTVTWTATSKGHHDE